MSRDKESVAGAEGRQAEADARRIAVVGIAVTQRLKSAPGEPGSQRLRPHYHRADGYPYRERGISVIALIVDGDTDTLGAMTGKLGSIPGVKVRTAITV